MSREKINWKVEKLDVKEFIKPLNIDIPIDKGQYKYIFNNVKIKNKKPYDYFIYLENIMLKKLYKREEYDKLLKILKYNFSLSYMPDFNNDNWKIGYSPIRIINTIFEILDINKKYEHIDYNNEQFVYYTKEDIKLFLIKEKMKYINDANNSDKLLFICDTLDNVENIFKLANFDVESRLEKSIIYKNLLYYLSVKSLDIFDDTGDFRYMLIPKQYYLEVSSKAKAEFPNQLYMNYNEVYSYNYSTFNNRFHEQLIRYPELFENSLGIEDIGIMNQVNIIKSDNFIDEVELDYNNYISMCKKYKKSDVELNEILNNKITFYRELMNMKDENNENIVVMPIKGENSLNGYYGFILKNNYIVLDKFFNTYTTKRVKPAYDEAIYSMPLDLFVELNGSKRKMMYYIKNNPKGNVKRYYHTKGNSYMNKILDIIKKEDISTISSDWFLNIYTVKKLTLNNK